MFMKIVCGLVAIAAAAPAAEWTKTFTVSGTPELRVETNDAAIRVHAGGKGRQIHARLIARGWEVGPGGIEVTERQTGSRVEIRVRVPEWRFGFGMRRSAVLEIETPREIATDIHTGDGSITIDGAAGSSRLVTGDGSIDASALDGALEAHTGDGRIVARGRFERVDIDTGDGSVEAEIRPGSKIDGSWRVRTGDGGIRVLLPADLAANLDVSTGDGSIEIGLPLALSGIKSRSNIRGRLNGGGPPLSIRSGDGSIRVERI
jgi:hypothetical protein